MLSKMILSEAGGTKASKVCGVCGDRAKSYHFGGISCDSCKAFFRRSVQNDAFRAFQCAFRVSGGGAAPTTAAPDGRCDINMTNRKCCQFCRFRKCLDIGMEPSWVMTEEERVHMLRARMVKRQRTGHHHHHGHHHHQRTGNGRHYREQGFLRAARIRHEIVEIESNGRLTVDQELPSSTSSEQLLSPLLLELGSQHSSIASPSPTPRTPCPSTIHGEDVKVPTETSPKSPNNETDLDSDLDDQDDDEVVKTPPAPLSAEESAEIDDIVTAFDGWFGERGEEDRNRDGSGATWVMLLLFMVSIQRLVKFARGVRRFAVLPLCLQIALLRANIFEMFLAVHFSRAGSRLFSPDILPAPLSSRLEGGSQSNPRKRKLDDVEAEQEVAAGGSSPAECCPFLRPGLSEKDSTSGSSDTRSLARARVLLSGGIVGDDKEEQEGVSTDDIRSSSFKCAFRSAVEDSRTMVLLLMVILFCPDSVPDSADQVESQQLHFCGLLGKYLRGSGHSASEALPPLPKLLLMLPALREIKESHVTRHFDLSNCEDTDIAKLLLLNSVVDTDHKHQSHNHPASSKIS